MIHAYDKNYLSKAQSSLASMIDFAVYDLSLPLEMFYQRFLTSPVSEQFGSGESSIIAGKSGVELALEVVGDDNLAKEYRPVANRSPEYWVGWALAYFQWQTNLSFKQINSLIPITEILAMYDPYHEMDISQFCDKMTELYNSRKSETNLKKYRLAAGLSQSELAEVSGVKVRTIQQYEQRVKNINAAKAESVIALSKALECPIEMLMEV
ncbi:MAG: helix-turn-helix domain-containing protein [Lachnospiraceae bacterium]|nr:helix-turn-helix domain-containing protein [Lachnospiraceae bacterium]